MQAVTMVDITFTVRVPEPELPYVLGRIEEVVAAYDGSVVGKPNVRPDTSGLAGLKLNGHILNALAQHGIRRPENLQGRTEEQVIGWTGMSWRRYRTLVRALRDLDLKLMGAPGFDDMIELLKLGPSPYTRLRKPCRGRRTFKRLSELTALDVIGLRLAMPWGIVDLLANLDKLGLKPAPLEPGRTLRDLLDAFNVPYYAPLSGMGGLETRLTDIDLAWLHKYASSLDNSSIRHLLEMLRDVGIDLGQEAGMIV